MNTQAHLIINLFLLKKFWKEDKPNLKYIFWGSLLPDIPMFIFWVIMSLLGTSQTLIFGYYYFTPEWQVFFNIFNSFLITLILFLLFLKLRNLNWMLFSISMFIHQAFDFLLHRQDAHAHFFPLTNWKFISPISYWERDYYGGIFGIIETITAVICAIYIFKELESKWSKLFLILGTGSLFFGHIFWVLILK